MKTAHILNCLPLLIPFNVIAHPGHDNGIIETAVAGAASGQFLSLTALLALGVLFAVARLYRRRKTDSADD